MNSPEITAIGAFEMGLNNMIKNGAVNQTEALNWLLDAEEVNSSYQEDVETYLVDYGLPYATVELVTDNYYNNKEVII